MDTNNMTLEQQLAALKAENERLKANQKSTPTEGGLLISKEKQAVSLYGAGRFPVTLHRGQWIRVFEILEAPIPAKLQSFFDKHKVTLDQVEARNKAKRDAAKQARVELVK